ncbi:hypothetical protein IFM89_022113 [Coptis chinensis]|uniref:Snakin-1 n=1 Tax=Coptis chinensis TaxID=261450 RepID=A0A835HRB1_9MAGN|nr:hypothetical protein IFM89_022113 [Coptis chinensis]
MRFFGPTFLLSTLLLATSVLQPTLVGSGSSYCDKKCSYRCALAGVSDRCLKYCGICCMECKCVPSGTFGNKHECPCYRDKKSSKGHPKCP